MSFFSRIGKAVSQVIWGPGDEEGAVANSPCSEVPPADEADVITGFPFSLHEICHIDKANFLDGHDDIVRHITHVGTDRIASASDSGDIIIWHYASGTVLVSGSSDRTLRFWDVDTGECTRVAKKAHAEWDIEVKNDAKTPSRWRSIDGKAIVCSGGNDEFLRLWTCDGELSSELERDEDENLNSMAALGGGRIVTGSDGALVLVYDLNHSSQRPRHLKPTHRDSISTICSWCQCGACKEPHPPTHFATASIDGAIIVWNADTLDAVYILNYNDTFQDEAKMLIFSVSTLLFFPPNYLAASIGHGFAVFDTNSGCIVLQKADAHEAVTTGVVPVFAGSQLFTTGADGSCRVWGWDRNRWERHAAQTGLKLPPKFMTRSRLPPTTPKSTQMKWDSCCLAWSPYLVADLAAHTGPINAVLRCNGWSVVTCGGDGLLVIWKDGQVSAELRRPVLLELEDPNNHDLDVAKWMDMVPPCPVGNAQMKLSDELASRAPQLLFGEDRESPPYPGLPDDIWSLLMSLYADRRFSVSQIVVLLGAHSLPDWIIVEGMRRLRSHVLKTPAAAMAGNTHHSVPEKRSQTPQRQLTASPRLDAPLSPLSPNFMIMSPGAYSMATFARRSSSNNPPGNALL